MLGMRRRLRFDEAMAWVLAAGPAAAVLGNAASDLWLSLVAAIFVIRSAMTRDWAWAQALWFRAVLAFWLWAILCALLSAWPAASAADAAAWIRFPVFIAALAAFLGRPELSPKPLLWAITVGVVILGGLALAGRLASPGSERLALTFGQGPKASWWLWGFGLPLFLLLFEQARQRAGRALVPPLLLAGFIAAAAVAAGQLRTMALFALATGIYVLASRLSRAALLGGALAAAAGAALIVSSPTLSGRVVALGERLPWMASSDYHAPWAGGVGTGLSAPLTGVGPHNFKRHCKALAPAERVDAIGVERCAHHPHNLYIQIFAETGLVGLALFSLAALLLLARCAAPQAGRAAALAIAGAGLWPVMSYSDAFGQHLNFFLAFQLGLALAIAGPMGARLSVLPAASDVAGPRASKPLVAAMAAFALLILGEFTRERLRAIPAERTIAELEKAKALLRREDPGSKSAGVALLRTVIDHADTPGRTRSYARIYLASAHYTGAGAPQDWAAVAELVCREEMRGQVPADFLCGAVLVDLERGPADPVRGACLLRAAAARGSASAQRVLAATDPLLAGRCAGSP